MKDKLQTSNNLWYIQQYKDADKTDEMLTMYVPDALVRDRKVREVLMEHGHATLGHSGDEKLQAYMKQSFYWPGMTTDIRQYCKTCPSCQACKPSTQKQEGLLHALPMPERPWQVIGMDFMGPFQISKIGKEEYDFLLVCIDHFSNEVELVPVHVEDNAEQVAQAYISRVYCHHGIPEVIVSDRDRRFISDFWRALQHSLGTTLAMSTSYHPETNGKTERMNRTINAMMRQMVSEEQTDWAEQIPFIQFAINSAKSSPTGYAPFELTRGYIPTNLPAEFQTPAATQSSATLFVEKAIKWQAKAKKQMLKAAEERAEQANKHRRPTIPPTIGDMLWLSTSNLSMVANRSRKWTPKYLGPYSVLDFAPDTDTVTLDLPARLTRRGIHNRVHVKETKRFVPSDDDKFPNRLTNRVPVFPS